MKRPNIVFVLIDDMGWKDLSCAGSQYYQTPHIDRLAENGIRFENAYSSSPVCSPSRGAIFTGKNPGRTKFSTVVGCVDSPDDRLLCNADDSHGGQDQHLEARHAFNLPSTETLFSEILAEAGYVTGYFGKWHCGVRDAYTPAGRGFQVAKGYRNAAVTTGTSGHWGETFKQYSVDMPIQDNDYLSERLTDECEQFIRNHSDRPFLAVLSHYLVHSPVQPKPDKLEHYRRIPGTDQDNPGYAAMVESVDESVGQLVAVLEELDLFRNTLFVFTSDNGGLSPKNTSNYPLMGGKCFPFEAGMKVPCIITWPAVVTAGQVTAERTIGMDFYPTFLEAAGIPLWPDQHVDSTSLMPVLTGSGSLPARPLVFHFPHYTGFSGPYASIIEENWKLIRFYNDKEGACLLFDLSVDPYELNDISAAKPEQVEQLARTLNDALDEMGAERPIPNPHYRPDAENLRNRATTYANARKHREELKAKASKSPRKFT